ncbi:DUF4124 domain-containing protein [Pseudoalteromonas sp. SSDWG2]|uniref:DUF4124 domain-containing protein n=1 Tax=Pseudoalteromonas sp. SSDWG2 TaxID=3139391 RepID=UPI003BA89297
MNIKLTISSVLLVLSMMVSVLSTVSANTNKNIYVYKDEKGNLVFSDTPRKGAEKVTLNSPVMDMPSTDTSILNEADDELEATKFTISVTSPTQEETIRDNTGSVHVSGMIKPRFLQGHKVQLFLDGQAHGQAQTSTLFVMRDVDRGEHNVTLKLVDSQGKVLATSKPVTFFLHRRSVITGP